MKRGWWECWCGCEYWDVDTICSGEPCWFCRWRIPRLLMYWQRRGVA